MGLFKEGSQVSGLFRICEQEYLHCTAYNIGMTTQQGYSS
jgi:hypothetical protein